MRSFLHSVNKYVQGGFLPCAAWAGHGDRYGVVPALRQLSLHREAEEQTDGTVELGQCHTEGSVLGSVIVSAQCDSPFSCTWVLSVEPLNYTWHVAGRGSMGHKPPGLDG